MRRCRRQQHRGSQYCEGCRPLQKHPTPDNQKHTNMSTAVMSCVELSCMLLCCADSFFAMLCCAMCCVLQDDVPPFPDEQAFSIIQQQLGRPLEAVFSSISEQPVAAASLGQVRVCVWVCCP